MSQYDIKKTGNVLTVKYKKQVMVSQYDIKIELGKISTTN